jgi:ABC-2 type transport system ATP-binding protein
VAIVEVAHLYKRYGPTVAVEDVSFTVAEGEIFGMLGPNGAGKTTTVESIIGLRVPDAGTIRVLGLDPLVDHAALHARVGVQLQESALPPKMRAGEALSLYASFYRHPDDPERLMQTLGLSDKRQTFFRDLSGGQKQRLSIALALIGNPTIAVLDELTTGLDPHARRDTWDLAEAVRDRGVTILLVTHDMEEAEHLCDRVALVDAGRVVAIDTPARLAEQAAGGKQVRFRPSAPFDVSLLTGLPEVSGLQRDGDWMIATGEGDLANAVILTLAEVGVSAHDIATASGALEDAFLALTGRGLREAGDEASPVRGGVRRDREHRAFRGWRTMIRHRRGSGVPPPRGSFGRLVASEWRLTLRNPAGLVWALGFPVLLLAIFGSLPATTKPDAAFGTFSFFEVYLPVMIALSLAMLALIGLPVPITSYRELGVLRRVATTPVPPSWILGAQVVVNLVQLVAAALLVVVGGLVFGARLPLHVMGFVLSLVLAATAMFALGLWVAAVARTQRAASAIGGGLFYPLLFFAGVWLPHEAMPSGLRAVSDLTPLGSAVQAMDTSMLAGQFPPAQSLLVLVAWAAIFGWLSVRMFRWE